MSPSHRDQSVQAAIGHITNAGQLANEKPYEIFIDTPPGQPKTNMEFGLVDGITVRDARSHGCRKFTLERSGFEFVNKAFADELTVDLIKQSGGDAALRSYLDPLGKFLKEYLSADQVILFEAQSPTRRGHGPLTVWGCQSGLTVYFVADESALCGYKIVREHLVEEEREKLDAGEGRFRIINIWRPLVPMVSEKPLALCDWSSVSSGDWELCDQVLKDRVDEAMYLKHKPEHQWWWMPDQQHDELSLFVVWDSGKFRQGHQASTPHAAFDLPGSRSGRSRESIEVRSIVWTRD
ncbi:hypothetical protein VTI28DRAFT_10615 [Corynascus sepedonium]